MIKPISDFVHRFHTCITLEEDMVVRKQGRYFLVNDNLKGLIAQDFYYAGAYLGKIKDGRFFPSFYLLSVIAKREANKIVVDRKTAWLFICGRDIFKKGIMEVIGSKKKGAHTLIMNEYGECLGFGKLVHDLDKEKEGVVVENISDIGDFLRREK